MAQIFHRSMTTIARVSVIGGGLVLVGLGAALYGLSRSPYTTNEKVAIEQVVPFSHKHHVAGLGIDCRYCHTSVEYSAFAGIPQTEICMSCHSQIWTEAPMLEPVRASWRTGESLQWVRVHDLPQFVYFDHSIHVNKGIGCSECHGRVDQMPLMWQHASLQMEWCLECHSAPEKKIRPREKVFQMDYVHPANQEELGKELVAKYNVKKLTDCYTCHR